MSLELLAVLGLGVVFAHVLDQYLFARQLRKQTERISRRSSPWR